MGDTRGTAQRIDALVSGKRRSRRYPVDWPICIKAVDREFGAVARDISTGGVLLEVGHAVLAGRDDAVLGPAEQLALVETHFRDPFDVLFPRQQVVLEARLVRLSVRPDQALSVFLGCQFVHDMGERQQRALGLLASHPTMLAWGAVEQLRVVTHVADERRPVSLMLHDDAPEVAGPRCAGRITAMAGNALVVHLDGVDGDELSVDLAGRELYVQVIRGGRAVWAARAALLAVRYIDGPRPGAEVALTPDPPPSRRVRRLFRKV